MRSFSVTLPSNSDHIPLWTDEPYPYTVEGMVEDVEIDVVFGTASLNAEEVRESLIRHDGYPDEISVEEN